MDLDEHLTLTDPNYLRRVELEVCLYLFLLGNEIQVMVMKDTMERCGRRTRYGMHSFYGMMGPLSTVPA